MKFVEMSESEYHRMSHISASRLKQMRQSAAYMKWMMDQPNKTTPDMRIGSAVHLLVTEPERRDEIVIVDVKTDKTKAFAKALALPENEDRLVVTRNELDRAESLAEKTLANSHIKQILAQGKAEQVLTGEIDGVDVKCMIDWFIPTEYKSAMIIDFKTISKTPRTLSSHIIEYGYHIQQAWYQKLVRLAGYDPIFIFIFIFKTEPCEIAIVELDDDFVSYGVEEMERLFDKYKTCKENDDWPLRYNAGTVEKVSLPPWIKR